MSRPWKEITETIDGMTHRVIWPHPGGGLTLARVLEWVEADRNRRKVYMVNSKEEAEKTINQQKKKDE